MRIEGHLPLLNRPIAVFDAGIGSYAAVASIQRLLPQQDILYFADRASFPYGSKSRSELLVTLRRTLLFLNEFKPAAVLVASNVPSITVLDDLTNIIEAPIFGIRPPIKEALDATGTGDIAVLGVQSMIQSPELQNFVYKEAQERAKRVHLVNASSLVDLVESGDFLFAPDKSLNQVSGFLDNLSRKYPYLAALTLSSTHLPWLRSYFEKAQPHQLLFDPLEEAIQAIIPCSIPGNSSVLALVTENERYRVHDFQQMLSRLNVMIPLYVVHL
ncbi:MAG: aspartate/glutamate racemase family protein [Phycisphaerales bacterium]|nr:aspartate/glutamate racemase family protein [Phycisphaerales bacterium]